MKAVSNGSAPIYYVKSSVPGQVAMEIEGSQAVLNRAYVYASGKLIAEQTPDGQFYWTHNDHLGSTRRLTNTSGAVVYRGEFDPFGKTVLETGSVSLNSHKFTGYERDWATGLDYANARMYASLRGRFMQSDPVSQGCGNRKPDILAGARQYKPQSLNRYGYVSNDPVNLIDPSGLFARNPEDECLDVYLDGIFWYSTCQQLGGAGPRPRRRVLDQECYRECVEGIHGLCSAEAATQFWTCVGAPTIAGLALCLAVILATKGNPIISGIVCTGVGVTVSTFCVLAAWAKYSDCRIREERKCKNDCSYWEYI